MVVSVEEVSSSLVREYLSRKGLKRTITCMDEEHPRTEASINNRSQLRQVLNIESLYRENKVHSSPLKTLLEIIVKHHISGLSHESDRQPPASAVASAAASPAFTPGERSEEPTLFQSKRTYPRPDVEDFSSLQPTHSLPETDSLQSSNQTCFPTDDSEDSGHPLLAPAQDHQSFMRREPEKRATITESTQRSKPNRMRRGMMAGPVASSPQEVNKKRPSRRAEAPQLPLRKQEEPGQARGEGLVVTGSHLKSVKSGQTEICSADCVGGRRESPGTPERTQSGNSLEKAAQDSLKTRKVKTKPNVEDLDVSEMLLDDVDDGLQEVANVSFQRRVHRPVGDHAGRPMDQRTAVELKELLLGSSVNCFSAEWRNQGFAFSETHDLRYGIVQKKGGPCGVLASVQAFVLKKLLFENDESKSTGLQRLTPSSNNRRKCLISAVAEILWRAGEEQRATVAISSGRNHFTAAGHYKSEGVLEKVTMLSVESLQDLQLLLEQHIEQFETGVLGCILLTLSAVLSRSVEKLREDMDVPTTTLIGAHGYCTQELVNLLLCGRALSNVFDNDMELDSGNGNMTLLKGMKGRCDVGLLSLFEHYNICKVGAYMKTPRYPIWVVCSESHFSVLFGLQRELLTSPDRYLEFDMYYYDGLANQQEEIRLTISVGKSTMSSQDPDLIPPLEHCIRTRWTDASVSWNDTEPIL